MNNKRVGIVIGIVLVVAIAIFMGFMFSNDNSKTYQVSFNTGTSELNTVIEVIEEGNVAKPADPTKEGYVFEGWYYNDEEFDFNTEITENITLTAKWKKVEESEEPEKITTYTVTFDSNGGSTVKSQIVEENKTATKPSNPTKNGYTFEGWYYNNVAFNFSTKITKNVTLTAKWKKVEEPKETVTTTNYTVKFDSNGGSTVKSQTVAKNKTAIKPTEPTRDGYTFEGWYLNAKAFDFKTKITKNITLIAKWKKVEQVVEPAKTYTVTFNTDGGSAVKAQVIEEGKTATKPGNPTKNGFTFEGWYLNGVVFDFNTKIVKDTTLTAKWKAVEPEPVKTYTVTFNSDGGSAVKAQVVEEGKTATRPADPKLDGYTFKGWYLNGTSFDFSVKVTSDVTLIAKWEKNAVIRWAKEPTISDIGQVNIVVYKDNVPVSAVVDFVMNTGTVVKDKTIPATGYTTNIHKVVDVINIRVK